MRFAITVLILAAEIGCAPRQFTLLREGNRVLLLPPGVRKAPSAQSPATDCVPNSAAITPRSSHYSVYGCYVQAGFVDLLAGMRLKIVKPVLATGEAIKTEAVSQEGLNLTVKSNLIGVDTQFLDVRPLETGVTVAVGFAPGILRYRLFFLARDLDRGRKITLIGARSAAELEASTKSLEEYCSQPAALCLAVSAGMVIGAQVPVSVQGRLEYFPLGASVGEALPKSLVTPNVRLSRLWRGRSTQVKPSGPGAPSILGMPLNGGDSIAY